MSKFASKHNSALERPFTFEIPEEFKYTDLKSMAAKYGIKSPFVIHAIYINKKGHFGDQPVLATDNELVNAPHHLMECVNDILADAESINLINRGHVGFKIYTYDNKYGTNYALEWVDL